MVGVLMINRFLARLLLVVAGSVGLGLYLGWCRLSTDHTDQNANLTITVDHDKIQEDREKARDRIHDIGERVMEKRATPTDKGNAEGPRP
jgi:hypothetical protein